MKFKSLITYNDGTKEIIDHFKMSVVGGFVSFYITEELLIETELLWINKDSIKRIKEEISET